MSTAGARFECPWCRKMKANLTEHRKTCKQRPEIETPPESPAPQTQAPQAATKAPKAVKAVHAKRPLKRATVKAASGGLLEYALKLQGKLPATGKDLPVMDKAVARELVDAGLAVGKRSRDGGHCEREACPYRGLSTHIARVRVQELVRGGLGIEDAARFVREHCA